MVVLAAKGPAPALKHVVVSVRGFGVRTPTVHLWRRMVHARAALHDVRRMHAAHTSGIEAARLDLVEALDSYVSRLTADGMPVPYRLRDELRMHKALLAAQRR